MVLVVWSLWVVVLLLAVITLFGPRWWYDAVTTELDPNAAAPSARGIALLKVRNVALLAAALAAALVVTFHEPRVDAADLAQAGQRATDALPTDDLTIDRLVAVVQLQIEPEIFSHEVTEEVREAQQAQQLDELADIEGYQKYGFDDATPDVDDGLTYYELSPSDDFGDSLDDDTAAATVCVVLSPYDGGASVRAVSEGRCGPDSGA